MSEGPLVSRRRRQRVRARVTSGTAAAVRICRSGVRNGRSVSRLRRLADTRCLVLDVGLPVMSGPDLQRELARRAQTIPIVFITAQADKSLRPRLLAAGAVACLFKPFSDTALIEAVEAGLGRR